MSGGTFGDLKALAVESVQGVTEVILRGPGKGNAMGPEFWREMPVVFASLDKDAETRVVIIRGSGSHFSYGLDLRAMMGEFGPHFAGDNLAGARTQLLDLIAQYQRAMNLVAACRKPVIAAVSGWCVGGGLDLIAACDIRLCSSDAKFSLREVKLAIVADVGSLQRLPRIIGEGNTRELALTGEDIDAPRALEMGLVNRVFNSADELLAATREVALQIAGNPPLTVQGIKRVMNECGGMTVEEGLRHVALWNAAFLQSKDLAEALGAFMERRSPQFKGE